MTIEQPIPRKRYVENPGPVLSGYLIVLAVITLGGVWFLLFPSINLLQDIFKNATDLSDLAVFEIVSQYVVWVVRILIYGVMWFLLGLFARNILRTWQWYPNNFRNLMLFGGLAIVVGFAISDWRVALAGIGHIVILYALAFTRFYPEYKGKTPGEYLRDLNFINVAWQSVFVIVVVGVVKLLWVNILTNLEAKGLLPTFEFLNRRAGFGINQAPDWYNSNVTYGGAFFVGVMNTLQVVSFGLITTTILGVLLGVFLLSNNWIIRTIARSIVEILRNTPLLVQLIFWYFVVILLILPEDDILIPAETVAIFPFRWVIYVIALIGMWIMSERQPDKIPSRAISGTFLGAILIEIVFRIGGDSYAMIAVLAIVGAVLIGASRQDNLIPEGYEGMAFGIGALGILQLAGHAILSGLHSAGWISHARFLYDEVSPAIYIGRTGFVFPQLVLTANFNMFALIMLVGIIIAVAQYIYAGRIIDRTGRVIPRVWYALGIIVLSAVLGWNFAEGQALPTEITIGKGEEAQVVSVEEARENELLERFELMHYEEAAPIVVIMPERNRFKRVLAGIEFDPSFMALYLGLVIYTAAFIGEIVRAGIQAVPYGQIEAARALGLSQTQTLRMIVLPQALRVIIPPMGNQYLNLSKNSSLATAIAFSDTYQIGQTMMNQSGQSITGFFLVLVVYLTMSLVISLFMNLVNSRFQLVTR